MIQLAEMIIRMTKSRSKLVFKPLPQDDPMQRKPIIDMAKEHLNWQPKIALEEGLDRTIAYSRTQLS